uniref:F-box domain-containing protein n=1 Tax=Parastrongyloides trichosuri TaxID=131310 RepID=A0A0N4ZBU9_PARTI
MSLKRTPEIPLYHDPELHIDGPDANAIFTVFSNDNILPMITKHLTDVDDRVNVMSTCKHFFNYMFKKHPRNNPKTRINFKVEVQLCRVEENYVTLGSNTTTRAIVLRAPGHVSRIIYTIRKVSDTITEEDVKQDMIYAYYRLRIWLRLLSHIITEVRVTAMVEVNHFIYKDVFDLIKDTLSNLRKVSVNSTVFNSICKFGVGEFEYYRISQRNVLFEVSADDNDYGHPMVNATVKDVVSQLPDDFVLSFVPRRIWYSGSPNLREFCPLNTMAKFRNIYSISNVTTLAFNEIFTSQNNIKELFLYCDDRRCFHQYAPSYSLKAFSTITSFTYCCNEYGHDDCKHGILSLFPINRKTGQNETLKSLSFAKSKFNVERSLTEYELYCISAVFVNITSLYLNGKHFPLPLDKLFKNFSNLHHLLLYDINGDQVNEYIEFVLNSESRIFDTLVLDIISSRTPYSINVQEALMLKTKYPIFEIDRKPVDIKDGKFQIKKRVPRMRNRDVIIQRKVKEIKSNLTLAIFPSIVDEFTKTTYYTHL